MTIYADFLNRYYPNKMCANVFISQPIRKYYKAESIIHRMLKDKQKSGTEIFYFKDLDSAANAINKLKIKVISDDVFDNDTAELAENLTKLIGYCYNVLPMHTYQRDNDGFIRLVHKM